MTALRRGKSASRATKIRKSGKWWGFGTRGPAKGDGSILSKLAHGFRENTPATATPSARPISSNAPIMLHYDNFAARLEFWTLHQRR